MEVTINGCRVRLVMGDITDIDTDAIVNAANSQLVLGAGVAGAIRLRGGPSIQQECNAIGGCNVGDAVITTGGKLPARYVIHAVGPHGSDPAADSLLESAALSSLKIAEENNLRSVAFPSISTGVFGYPVDDCARVMLSAVIDYLTTENKQLQLVIFCLYGPRAYEIFKTTLGKLLEAGG
nr:macro domain-containing protein [Anaerolineae bacterium]